MRDKVVSDGKANLLFKANPVSGDNPDSGSEIEKADKMKRERISNIEY